MDSTYRKGLTIADLTVKELRVFEKPKKKYDLSKQCKISYNGSNERPAAIYKPKQRPKFINGYNH